MKIREIIRAKDRTYVRTEDDELEISGGEEGFRAWVAEQSAIADRAAVGIQLREHMKTDPSLTQLDTLRDKQVVLALADAKVEAVAVEAIEVKK